MMAGDYHALSWKCHACNMVFTNPSMLQKHRGRFCVGKWDPEFLLLSPRRDESPRRPPPEDKQDASHMESLLDDGKKVGELQDYKDKRRRDRELNNLEQRILLDQIAEGQTQRHNKHKTVPWSVGNRDRLPLAKDKDVRHLQIEYERAREKGFKRPNPVVFAPQHRYRKPYLPETVTPRYNPNTDPKVQQLAEIHGRQMEHLQNRNRDLERQREEIRRRLEELGRRPPEKDNSTDELLRELREQEARNQRLLNELRLQLAEARRPINVVQQHAPPEPQQGKRAFVYPIYYGNSLVAEIIACRQAYLQNGGNDPDILAQLAQMLAEAQAIDDSMKNVQRKQPKDKKDGSSQLLALEFENERLQRQLMLLQEQKIISGNRRKDNHREGRTPDHASRPASPNRPPSHQSPPHVLPIFDESLPHDPKTKNEPPSQKDAGTQPKEAGTQHKEAGTQHKEAGTQHKETGTQHTPRNEPDTKHEPPTHAHPDKQPTTQQAPPYKPAPAYKTMSKWVQTNPVPSQEADISAFARIDYPTKRQNARLALEDRWGSGNVLPTPAGGPQPLRRASHVDPRDIRRVAIGGPPEPPVTVQSLQPERLDTIVEAANVDNYNPEEPLEVDLSSLQRRKHKHFFPYRPDIGPRRNSARLVIVTSDKRRGWVDFYGREVDEKGTLLDKERPVQRFRQTAVPQYTRSVTDPRLLAYQRHLNSMNGRSSDLQYDPQYSSLYPKRRLFTIEPLDIDTKSILGPRESTYPLIQQNREHRHDDQQVPKTANAEAQTQPLKSRKREERLEARPTLRKQPMAASEADPELNLSINLDEDAEPSPWMGIKRQAPPTQRPASLGPQTVQPAAANPQPPQEDQKGRAGKQGSRK